MSITIPGIGRIKDQSVASAAQWAASTIIVPDGTLAVEREDGLFKIGNGADTYANLAYETGKIGDLSIGGGGMDLPAVISGGGADTVFTFVLSGGNAAA